MFRFVGILLGLALTASALAHEPHNMHHEYYQREKPNAVYMVDSGTYWTFYGHKKQLSRVILDAGDIVCGGVMHDPHLRKVYLEYVDAIQNQQICVAKNGFLEGDAEAKFYSVMESKGIEIIERQE